MNGINTEWAIAELDTFIAQTERHSVDPGPGIIGLFYENAAPQDEITGQAQVIEEILGRVFPGWRSYLGAKLPSDDHWQPLRDIALRARELLTRQDEVKQNLGDDAPEISAARLHPWVWNGASSLWQSGHYRQAVEDALKKVNAETQNKLGRRDVSETDLFSQAFSDNAATPNMPRLRRMTSDGSDTYKSMQRGARSLAEGLYAGIRNPFGHGDPSKMDINEQVGLEYLAAISVLARWVDDAAVEVAS